MKRTLFCAVLLGLVFSIVPSLFAESFPDESDYYYVSVPIEKIYLHRDGYVVAYRAGKQYAQVYIPMEWFSDTAGKADVVLTGSGSTWPYMVLYYKAGEFSHLRLIVRRDRKHQTWGTVPLYVNINENFQKVDKISLEY